MENFDTGNNETTGELIINIESENYLRIIAKWANVLSIIGFIVIGLLTLMGFVFFFYIQADSMPQNSPVFFKYIGLFYPGVGFLYFRPTFYLFKFSINTKKSLKYKNQDLLTSGLGYLKSAFKYVGIITIVFIAVYFLGTLGLSLFFHK